MVAKPAKQQEDKQGLTCLNKRLRGVYIYMYVYIYIYILYIYIYIYIYIWRKKQFI